MAGWSRVGDLNHFVSNGPSVPPHTQTCYSDDIKLGKINGMTHYKFHDRVELRAVFNEDSGAESFKFAVFQNSTLLPTAAFNIRGPAINRMISSFHGMISIKIGLTPSIEERIELRRIIDFLATYDTTIPKAIIQEILENFDVALLASPEAVTDHINRLYREGAVVSVVEADEARTEFDRLVSQYDVSKYKEFNAEHSFKAALMKAEEYEAEGHKGLVEKLSLYCVENGNFEHGAIASLYLSEDLIEGGHFEVASTFLASAYVSENRINLALKHAFLSGDAGRPLIENVFMELCGRPIGTPLPFPISSISSPVELSKLAAYVAKTDTEKARAELEIKRLKEVLTSSSGAASGSSFVLRGGFSVGSKSDSSTQTDEDVSAPK